MSKCFVLDTNILVDDPDAPMKFEENDVAIVDVTLDELDGLKKSANECGFGARKAIRNINQLFQLSQTPGGGRFLILPGKKGLHPDDVIVNAVLCEQDKFRCSGKKTDVILVSNDIAIRIKMLIKGGMAQEYKNPIVKESSYMGWRKIVLPDEDWKILSEVYKGAIYIDFDYLQSLSPEPFEENEYLLTSCGNQSAIFRVQMHKKRIMAISKKLDPVHVIVQNVRQKMALDALLAPVDEIPLVILNGPTGCAKTFLALASGIDGIFGSIYNKVIITRNNVLSDHELGYLKGGLEEKMNPLLAPFYDNLQIILRGSKNESMEQVNLQIEDLKLNGSLEIASMAYMRGRSIADSFLIIDEVQNATQKQVLNIVTRAAKGTKVILCGDPDQIDAPYLIKENNGLVFASEKMKGSQLCAQITFTNEDSIRSPLAYEAAIRFGK